MRYMDCWTWVREEEMSVLRRVWFWMMKDVENDEELEIGALYTLKFI